MYLSFAIKGSAPTEFLGGRHSPSVLATVTIPLPNSFPGSPSRFTARAKHWILLPVKKKIHKSLEGSVVECLTWFETHRRHCVVSLSKTLYPLFSTDSTQETSKMTKKIVAAEAILFNCVHFQNRDFS